MLTEQQAVAAAKAEFDDKIPNAVLREITWFTVDSGLTWTVHFRRPERVEVDPETGNITTTVESNDSWVIFVDGQSGQAWWGETL